jgi:hypothetical protein
LEREGGFVERVGVREDWKERVGGWDASLYRKARTSRTGSYNSAFCGICLDIQVI